MEFRVKITPAAFSDLREGIDYYKLQQNGLGKRFHKIIHSSIDSIRIMPLAASIAYDDVRYKVVKKFP